jgi:hypothetical protein
VDDLSVSADVFLSVVQRMPLDLRQLVSHAALSLSVDHDEAVAQVLRTLSAANRFALLEEIENGKCFVIELGSGLLQRVKIQVVLDATCADERQLVELGTPCRLPSTGMNEMETEEEVVERLRSSLQAALANPVSFLSRTKEITNEGQRYGLQTVCVHMVHKFTARGEDGEGDASSSSSLQSESLQDALRRVEVHPIESEVDGLKWVAWLTANQWRYAQTPEGEAVVGERLASLRGRGVSAVSARSLRKRPSHGSAAHGSASLGFFTRNPINVF